MRAIFDYDNANLRILFLIIIHLLNNDESKGNLQISLILIGDKTFINS